MQPADSTKRWFAAAVCVLATTGITVAEEAVIRISDSGKQADAAETTPATHAKRMAPPSGRAYYQSQAYSPQDHFASYARYYGLQQPASVNQTSDKYLGSARMQAALAGSLGQPETQQVSFTSQVCAPDCNQNIYTGDMGCTSGGWCQPGCGSEGCVNGNCNMGDSCCDSCDNYNSCQNCDPCDGWSECDSCDSNRNRVRLFTRALPKDPCGNKRFPKRWWRGQQTNYLARNQRLANCLFGWMVPSGCCGQGCPPVGCYDITYADNPGYADPRDGQQWGAQGYGTPVTVPLAPNVRYQYNYSWGTPSSRLTPIGQYDPQTSLQPLYRQTW